MSHTFASSSSDRTIGAAACTWGREVALVVEGCFVFVWAGALVDSHDVKDTSADGFAVTVATAVRADAREVAASRPG